MSGLPWGLVQPEASGPTRSKCRFYKTAGVLNIFVVKKKIKEIYKEEKMKAVMIGLILMNSCNCNRYNASVFLPAGVSLNQPHINTPLRRSQAGFLISRHYQGSLKKNKREG